LKEKLSEFFREKRWRQMKKGDWLILALVGVLLLVIAMPTTEEKSSSSFLENQAAQTSEQTDVWEEGGSATNEETEYVTDLEARLSDILSQMDGVGKVKVMITVSDSGETVVEKDLHTTSTTTTETDGSGAEKTTTQGENISETLFVEENGDSYPYVKKEKLPTISGVVVVAEGAGSPTVVSNISKTVEALFSVEAHKIMVVKMHAQEDAR
jgi:stage III sporulation protein AG